MYWYPPLPSVRGAPVGTGVGYPASDTPSYVTETERNIPEGTVALKKGAPVISTDGEHVGDVEEVLTGPQADRATHFVVSEGLLLKERKLVPTTWVNSVSEDKVHLVVGSSVFEELHEYHA